MVFSLKGYEKKIKQEGAHMKRLLAILLVCALFLPSLAAFADVTSIKKQIDTLNVIEKQELIEYLRYSISVDNLKKTIAKSHALFTRKNPMTVGQTAIFSMSGIDCYLTLKSVNRGESVNKEIEEANMFNTKPSVGQEYIKVLFHFSTIANESSELVELNHYNFDLVSSSGKVIQSVPMIAGIEDSISVYSGGEGDFVCVRIIDIKDNPYLVFADIMWIDLSSK